MKLFISSANEILNEWKKEYDILSSVRLQFHCVSEKLFLNNIALNVRGNLCLSSASYDAKHIVFYLDEYRSIHINIAWPEEKVPYVSAASFIDSGI